MTTPIPQKPQSQDKTLNQILSFLADIGADPQAQEFILETRALASEIIQRGLAIHDNKGFDAWKGWALNQFQARLGSKIETSWASFSLHLAYERVKATKAANWFVRLWRKISGWAVRWGLDDFLRRYTDPLLQELKKIPAGQLKNNQDVWALRNRLWAIATTLTDETKGTWKALLVEAVLIVGQKALQNQAPEQP